MSSPSWTSSVITMVTTDDDDDLSDSSNSHTRFKEATLKRKASDFMAGASEQDREKELKKRKSREASRRHRKNKERSWLALTQRNAELQEDRHGLKKEIEVLNYACRGYQEVLEQHEPQCCMVLFPTPLHCPLNQSLDTRFTSFCHPGCPCPYPSASLNLLQPPGTCGQQRQVCQPLAPAIASHKPCERGYQQQVCQPPEPVRANQAPETEDNQWQVYQKPVCAVSANQAVASPSHQQQLDMLTVSNEQLHDEMATSSSGHSDVIMNSVTTLPTASNFGEPSLIRLPASYVSDFNHVQSAELQRPLGAETKCGFVAATDHMDTSKSMAQFLLLEDGQNAQRGVGAQETVPAGSGVQARQLNCSQLSPFVRGMDAPPALHVQAGLGTSHQSRTPGQELDTLDDLISILAESAGKGHALKPGLLDLEEEREDLQWYLTSDAFQASLDPSKFVMAPTSTETTITTKNNSNNNTAKLLTAEAVLNQTKSIVGLEKGSKAGPEQSQTLSLSALQNVRLRPGVQHVAVPTPYRSCRPGADTDSQRRGTTTQNRLWYRQHTPSIAL